MNANYPTRDDPEVTGITAAYEGEIRNEIFQVGTGAGIRDFRDTRVIYFYSRLGSFLL